MCLWCVYVRVQNIKPLIWVECQVHKPNRSRVEYVVKARSQVGNGWSHRDAIYSPPRAEQAWHGRTHPLHVFHVQTQNVRCAGDGAAC
jgi:hypothetical protein